MVVFKQQHLVIVTAISLLLIVAGMLFFLFMPQKRYVGELNYANQPVLGAENATVNVALFEDFTCPHCANFTEEVFPKIVRDFADDSVAFYFFNVGRAASVAQSAALAAECVYQQENASFWEYKKILMRSQRRIDYSIDTLVELAATYTPTINLSTLETCLTNKETLEAFRGDVMLLQTLELASTPSILINGELISTHSYEYLKNTIQQALDR